MKKMGELRGMLIYDSFTLSIKLISISVREESGGLGNRPGE